MNDRNVRPFKDRALAALENVIDPELGIDIVNLGLIYQIDLAADGVCHIQMTLTIVGCPLTEYLDQAIQEEISGFEEVTAVQIELVFEPAWSIDKMSREARYELGIH